MDGRMHYVFVSHFRVLVLVLVLLQLVLTTTLPQRDARKCDLGVVLAEQFQSGEHFRLSVLDCVEQSRQLSSLLIFLDSVAFTRAAQNSLERCAFFQQLADEVAVHMTRIISHTVY